MQVPNFRKKLIALVVIMSGLLLVAVPKRSSSSGPGPDDELLPRAPSGALIGTVHDARGRGVEGVEVALFDSRSLELVEHTTSDVIGRFAFQAVPEFMHVYAMPADFHSLCGRWLFDLEAASTNHLDIGLRPGRHVGVRVVDRAGQAIAGAQLRAYDSALDSAANVSLASSASTDASGYATLLAPAYAHIAIAHEEQGFAPEWKLWQHIPAQGLSFDVTLDEGRALSGRVLSESSQALEGIVVSAWTYDRGWRFAGYDKSAADGSYQVMGSGEWTLVRAVDPAAEHGSSAHWSGPTGSVEDLHLPEGHPLSVRCVGPDGSGAAARVWFYSYETRSWSWGGLTDQDGNLQGMVSASYAISVRPLSAELVGQNLWNQSHAATEVELDLQPARAVRLEVVSRSDGAPLANFEVRGYSDDWVWIDRGLTDAAGQLELSMPSLGLGRFRAHDLAPQSSMQPAELTLNLADPDAKPILVLDELSWIEGRVEGPAGLALDEELSVTAWNAEGWARTGRCRTSDGHFALAVPESYHLRVEAVDPHSHYLPTWQWWNELGQERVHARTPLVLTQGWFGDVQVVSAEDGGPVRGVRVHGGHPQRVSSDDGWAREILLRPEYSLRHYPPAVSSPSALPIVPDLVREHRRIRGDRTQAGGCALEPLRVWTERASWAHGRVEGELPSGASGPLAGVRVQAFGGHRPLGWTTTDSRGEFHLQALKHAFRGELATDVLFEPSPAAPYLPTTLNALELSSNTELGSIALDSSAFGTGTLVDAFAEPLRERSVFFVARRTGESTTEPLGGWGVDERGEFMTKLAPRTTYHFSARAGHDGWESKDFDEPHEFHLGESVDLGQVELGAHALVEVRALSALADAGRQAAPIARVQVELVDDASGHVYDWQRTDDAGLVQLRGPQGVALRLRYCFWPSTNRAAADGLDGLVGFADEGVAGANARFAPQLSEAFSLTSARTDFGEVYLGSPLWPRVDAFLRLLDRAPVAAFSSDAARRALYSLASTAGRLPAPAGGELDARVAKSLLSAGFELFSTVSDSLPTSISDPDLRVEALNLANAVMNEMARVSSDLEVN